MDSLIKWLNEGHIIAGDGAMGTMLQQMGYGSSACPEALNLSDPHVLEQIAESYLDAGAEILQTNTFGGSPIRLAMFDLESKSEEINRTGAALVRKVAGDRAWVTGSCGPCGRHLLPYGDLDPTRFKESCKRQLGALTEGGVDGFSIETMMDVEEAVLAIQAAREIAPDIVIMVSATFNKTPTGFFTPFGTVLKDVAQRFSEEGADVIGANCGTGMDDMIEIARQFREAGKKPILIRPNAGLPEMKDGKPIWQETPEQFAAGTRELIEIGVAIIGGCCGTTPEHIRQVRRVIDEWRNNYPKFRFHPSQDIHHP